MLDGRPDTRPGLMFGFPAFYAAGKLVACVYSTGLGLRLPPEEAAELRGRTSRTFEPYGRTMRAWTFLEPVAPEELRVEQRSSTRRSTGPSKTAERSEPEPERGVA